MAALGDLVEINPAREPGDSDPIGRVMLADVDERFGTVAIRSFRHERPPGRRARGGDVLFAGISPAMENGKVAVLPGEDAVLVSSEFFVLRPRGDLDPRLIWAFLRQDSLRSLLRRKLTGSSGRQRLRAAALARVEVPLLPDTQRQAKALAALEHLDSARRLREQATGILKALPGASAEHIAADAPRRELRQLFLSQVGIGTSERTAEHGQVPVLRAANVVDGEIAGKIRYVRSGPERATPTLEPGDLVLVRSGTPERIGQAAIYEGEPAGATHASYLVRIRVGGVDPNFLLSWLQGTEARTYFQRRGRRQGRRLYLDDAAILSIPVPEVSMQDGKRGAAVSVLARELIRGSRAQFGILGAAIQAYLAQVFGAGAQERFEADEITVRRLRPRENALPDLFAAASREQQRVWERVLGFSESFALADLAPREGDRASTQRTLALLEQLGVLIRDEREDVRRWHRPEEPDLLH